VNINRTYIKHNRKTEGVMQDLVYDVLSLMTMSGFLVMAAVWIGAL
jgi:predicted GNAT family acetyltransferase